MRAAVRRTCDRANELAAAHEIVLLDVIAAAADARCWRDDELVLDERRTLHHLGGGRFRTSGDLVDARA
jgi:hypothetical protein